MQHNHPADETDEAPETGAKQEDVDTATTSNYSIIQAWGTVRKGEKILKLPEQTKLYVKLILVFKSFKIISS